MNHQRLKEYIGKVKWQFAKTMPLHPHWYTLVTWNVTMESEFRYLAEMIYEHGISERFNGYPQTYLYIDDFKYWIMSKPNECILINRARV